MNSVYTAVVGYMSLSTI